MADTIALTSGGLSAWVTAAQDRLLYFGLRSEPCFRSVADVKPALQAMPGSSVAFRFATDLATATSALTESSDVDRVDGATSTVSVTLVEYGNVMGSSAKLRATGFLDVDAAEIELISYNAVDSIDEIVRDVLVAGTNVRYSATEDASAGRTNIDDGDTLASSDVRYVTAKLRGNKAQPVRGTHFLTFIHPDVSHDLRAEAGDSSKWREAHTYASPDAIYAGEIGAYEGQVFIETPRAKIFANASDGAGGAGNVDVYATVTVGKQALAEAIAIEPHVVQAPVVDRLRRFVSHGWYALAGWSRFRENALYRVESSSSIGTNS